jgi:hypothetical protein
MSYALNSETNRFVKVGSKTYIRLHKMGKIQNINEQSESPPEQSEQPELQPEQPEPVQKPLKPEPGPPQFDNIDFKALMAKTLTDVIHDRQKDFVDISQKQTDKLLKKLLYEKLCLEKPKKVKSKKSKSKKKFKIVEPSSESEDSEESESD